MPARRSPNIRLDPAAGSAGLPEQRPIGQCPFSVRHKPRPCSPQALNLASLIAGGVSCATPAIYFSFKQCKHYASMLLHATAAFPDDMHAACMKDGNSQVVQRIAGCYAIFNIEHITAVPPCRKDAWLDGP